MQGAMYMCLCLQCVRVRNCLSLFEGQVQGLGAHPTRYPRGTNRLREKRQVPHRQNRIKYIFEEHSRNWSRNNLIAPLKICLDFQGP